MKGIFASLMVALAVICAMLFSLYTVGSVQESAKKTGEKPRYHVQIITQNTNAHFWTTFKKGAADAGKKFNVYVEFVDVVQNNAETSTKTLEKAIFSKVDGIAMQAEDQEKTSALLQTARKNKMAVLTFENDHYFIPDVPTVGSNSYDIGYREAEMGVQACNGKGRVAIIVNGAGNQATNQYKNMKLQGMMDVFSKYKNIQVQEVYTLSSGMFETEKLMGSILSNSPKISLILCTDERSTPGIAQVLVDSNRVGDVAVVGYGAMPQTLNYIKSGVIYGSICPDAYTIGYDSVQQLTEVLSGGHVSDVVNTDLFSINAGNVGKYQVSDNEK